MATFDSKEDDFHVALETARSLLGTADGDAALQEANDIVNQALALRPKAAEAWIVKCQVLSALDDDAAALAAIEMAVRRAPRLPEAHYWRTAVLSDLGRHTEALRAADCAFRNLGDQDSWLLEDLYCEQAMILNAMGKPDEALDVFETGLRRCPGSSVLQAGAEPLRRERIRSSFRVIPGGA